MTDITLIHPHSDFLINPRTFPPLGILYLSASLKMMGFSVKCLDLSLGHSLDDVDSKYVGVSFTSSHRKEAFEIAEKLKSKHILIAGGAHPTHEPNECLEHFNYVVQGEADYNLPSLLTHIKLCPVPNENFIMSPSNPTDINFIPFPDRSALPIKEYQYYIDGELATTLMTSRSCPSTCLRGDTPINTINGMIPIRELTKVEGAVKVLTINPKTEEAMFVPVYRIWKTRKDSELVRVKFDDGTFIDCTPDHLFKAFWQGSSRINETEAQQLQIGMSVKACRFEVNPHTERTTLSWGRRKGCLYHRLVMEGVLNRKLQKEEIVHHIDKDKKNNDPSNLLLTTTKEHLSVLHPELSERMKINNPVKFLTAEGRRKGILKIKGKKRSIETRIKLRESKLGSKNPRYKQTSNYKYLHRYTRKSRIENFPIVNHKITSVEFLNDKDDVYCMELPGYDWFFANNVLVHNCSFCAKISNKFRQQSAQRTVDEILYVHNTYGYKAFMIFDDTFSADRKRLSEIVLLLKGYDFKFRCFGRANQLTPEVCELLKKMNVVEVGIGIESGSNEILKLNMKGTNPQQNLLAIGNLRREGIRSKAFIIVGLPGESEKTIKETSTWLRIADPDDVDFSVFQPMPGSAIYKNPELFGVTINSNLVGRWYKGAPDQYESSCSTKYLTGSQIVAARNELETKFKKKEFLR